MQTQIYIEKACKCFCKVCEYKKEKCNKGYKCVAHDEFREALIKEIKY